MNTTLTQWFSPDTPPVHIGEYNASCYGQDIIRRWWDGHAWSPAYVVGTKRPTLGAYDTPGTQKMIWWRGLAYRPRAKRLTKTVAANEVRH